jgi:hypothetical protein
MFLDDASTATRSQRRGGGASHALSRSPSRLTCCTIRVRSHPAVMGETMSSARQFGSVGHDFPRKDAVARVTGRELYSVDGYSSGVASSNARCARIPVSEVV